MIYDERFWEKVSIGDDCWTWTAGKTGHGYGTFKESGSSRNAHSVAYESMVGPVPPGMQLDHTCHTKAVARGECTGGADCPHRACVNPGHLEPVTHAENARRGLHHNTRKTRCPRGHAYDAVNIRGERFCRQCARA
jgi:hypothetical protein